ncbi:hypothetical protein Pfo_013153 [Paulownia fortunei]|nr:hypothetical protein Pfo_013153 [Paulownia fortunei]
MVYRSSCLAGLLVLALISCSPPGPAKAMSCTQALEYLMPCQPFLMGIGEITSPCCLGAQALAQATASPADRKSVCQCLKQVAVTVNVNQDKAKQLPQLCKIDFPVPVQPDINCDAIPLNDVRLRLNQYKNLDRKAFRPTTPGHSPGMGH